MSKWDEAFQQHPVHASLKRVRAALTKLHGPSLPAAEMLERFVAAEQFVARKLNSVDPILVTAGQLDALNAVAVACATDLEAHIAKEEGDHWTNATSRIDPLIQAAIPLPAVITKKDVDGIRESAVRFRRSAGQLISKLQKKTAEVEQQVATIRSTADEQAESIEAASAEITEKLRHLQDRAEELEEERRSAISEAVRQSRAILEEVVTESRSCFEALEGEWTEKLTEHVDSYDERVSALVKKVDADLRTALTNATTATQAVLDELERLKESAKESVGIIASTGMAGGYEKTANEEKAAADLWRKVATGSFVGLVAIALALAFWPLLTRTDLSWQSFAAKAYASLAFGLLAAYAGREAEKHRRAERQHRQWSLELRSLNPYLEPLAPDQQAAVRSIVADRIFGRDGLQPEKPQDGETPGVPSVIDVLRLLIPKA